MLKVLTKTATFVENVWHGAGTEILIAEHHFSDEVHILLEDLGLEKKPVAAESVPAEETAPPAAETPLAAPPHPTAEPTSEPTTAAAAAAPEGT